MNENVLLVGESSGDLKMMHLLLKRLSYSPVIVSSLEAAADIYSKTSSRVAVLDLDSMVLNNRIIRKFKHRFPRVNLILCSVKRFHPELKEAITDHVYACVAKPIDSDELAYLLASIHQNGAKSRDGPPHLTE